jgi:hypothetical protein
VDFTSRQSKAHAIALTVIDMVTDPVEVVVTDPVEVVRTDNKTAAHVALHFENTWLSRYLRPIHLIYDQGGEFTACSFQNMLNRLHRPFIVTCQCEESSSKLGLRTNASNNWQFTLSITYFTSSSRNTRRFTIGR